MTPTPSHSLSDPLPWVTNWLQRVPSGALVLDFAAGSGRHSIAAKQRGCTVIAADRNVDALAEIGEAAQIVQTDLENAPWPFESASFDAVIVTNYLYRPRLDLLAGLLAPSGWLIYQTFAIGNERFGRPSNPSFLLQPGELAAMCERTGLQIAAYEHGQLTEPDAMVQRIAAFRPDSSNPSPGALLGR